MLEGDTSSWQFNNPGTYNYFCKVHAYKVGESWAGMVGTVIEPSDALAAVSYALLGIAIGALIVAVYPVVRRKPQP